jgi:hypothetical protein
MPQLPAPIFGFFHVNAHVQLSAPNSPRAQGAGDAKQIVVDSRP